MILRSKVILAAMLANGFLDAGKHNPNDYVNYVASAGKRLEAALRDVKKHEEVADLVAVMFESGFCTADAQNDPNEWIIFAESAIAELKVL